MRKHEQAVVDQWKQKIATDNRWTYRALLRIYQEQTADEQQSGYTKHDNGVGFSGRDAEFLSSLARGLEKWNCLTKKQLVHAQRIMPKYAGQLFRLTYPDGIPKPDAVVEFKPRHTEDTARLNKVEVDPLAGAFS